MINTGFKLYAGIAFLALFAAVLGGYTSGGTIVGPISAGWLGGIGDYISYVVLLGVAFSSVAVGGLLTYFRDADAEAVAASLGTAVAPVGQRPVDQSIWPIVAGLGAAFIIVGMAINAAITGVGFVIISIVAFEWTMTAWADRATGDPKVNQALRAQIMGPFEIPLLGLLFAGVIVIAVSRILLTTSELGAVIVGGAVAVVILSVGIFLALGPKLSKNLMTGIVGVLIAAVLIGGVWGAASGTREIEEEHEEETELINEAEESAS